MDTTTNQSQPSSRNASYCWTFDATLGSQDVPQNFCSSKCSFACDQRFCCFTAKEFSRLVLDYRKHDRFTNSFGLYFHSFVFFLTDFS